MCNWNRRSSRKNLKDNSGLHNMDYVENYLLNKVFSECIEEDTAEKINIALSQVVAALLWWVKNKSNMT